jgi:hypothetical protein
VWTNGARSYCGGGSTNRPSTCWQWGNKWVRVILLINSDLRIWIFSQNRIPAHLWCPDPLVR